MKDQHNLKELSLLQVQTKLNLGWYLVNSFPANQKVRAYKEDFFKLSFSEYLSYSMSLFLTPTFPPSYIMYIF